MNLHEWKARSVVKTPGYCIGCGNLVWGISKVFHCGVCKRPCHFKCFEKYTIDPCKISGHITAKRTSSDASKALGGLASFTVSSMGSSRFKSISHKISPTESSESGYKQSSRMSEEEFTFKLETKKLPPHPLPSKGSSSDLETILSWKSTGFDSPSSEDEERARLFVTFFDTDPNVASAMYQAFRKQHMVHITSKSMLTFINEMYPPTEKTPELSPGENRPCFTSLDDTSFLNKYTKERNPQDLSKSEEETGKSTTEEEEEEEEESRNVPKKHLLHKLKEFQQKQCSIPRLSRSLDVEENVLRATVKHKFFKKGKKGKVNCLVVPCTVHGYIACNEKQKSMILLNRIFDCDFEVLLKNKVEDTLMGELSPAQSFLMKTSDQQIPWICCIVYPIDCAFLDPYSSLWSVLSTIWESNHSIPFADRVSSILCPTFQNITAYPPETAKRLYIGYRSFITKAVPKRRSLFKEKKNRMRTPVNASTCSDSYQTLFIILLLKGELLNRDHLSKNEIKWLIEIVNGNLTKTKAPLCQFPTGYYEDIFLAAAQTITKFTFPEQQYRNLRNEVLANNCLSALLDLVPTEKIKVHREICASDIEMDPVPIATGACGVIYSGIYQGIPVAVKTFREFTVEEERKEFFRELGICSILQHPNLLLCYGACTSPLDGGHRFLVVDFLQRGSLWDVLESNQQLSPAIRMNIGFDCASAVHYLHKHDIIHRDLKSLNVLVTDDDRARVIDFGTSRIVSTGDEMTHNLGTTMWMAPEVFVSGNYDTTVDVYSFGIIMWELYTSQKPYANVKGWDIPNLVMKGERPPIPDEPLLGFGDWYVKLMKMCWHPKPIKRPSFAHICEMFQYNLLNGGADDQLRPRVQLLSSDSNGDGEGKKKKKRRKRTSSSNPSSSLSEKELRALIEVNTQSQKKASH